MATLTVTQDEDYRDGSPPIAIGTDAIIFNTSDNATARFLSLQFNDVLIDNNVAITGDTDPDTIAVHTDGDAVFSAAGWTFTNWTGNDVVRVFGTDAAETITGSSEHNVIDGGGGADTLTGGDSENFFLYFTEDDLVVGETVDGKGGTDTVSVNSGSFDFSQILTSIEELFIGGLATVTLDRLDIIGLGAITSITGNTLTVQSLIVNGGSVDLSGVVFTNWTNGQDTITINGNAVSSSNIVGSSQNDTVIGGANGDVLNGGGGADRLVGGGSGDEYRVDNAGDVVDESVAGSNGSDTVIASINFSLADTVHVKGAVEGLVLANGVAINATGNALDNGINGNNNDNTIDGGAGADRMRGRLGNDTYIVDNFGDVVDEAASGGGTDLVRSSISFSLSDGVHVLGSVEKLTLIGSATAATGNQLANVLTGNGLANALDGRGSFDTMRGLRGNDTYFVDHAGDVVDESQAGSGGTDQVRSSISFSLANTVTTRGLVENLTLLGNAGVDGTGNGLANVLVGNSGANVLTGAAGDDALDGRGGADRMIGGAGKDGYTVDSSADVVDESAAGSNGADTIFAFIDFSLSDDVHAKGALENLTLRESAVSATGNALANVLVGNAAANVLSGRGGNDILTGGDGADQILFDAAISKDKSVNLDHITDFTHFKDDILLDKSIFTKLKLGNLKKGAFKIGKKAKDGDDRIVYNQKTDELAYDKDGNHKAKAIVFAVLDSSPDGINHKDFIVVA